MSDALRIIYNLVEKGHLDNALWEIMELEQYLKDKNQGLMEKHRLKTYFTKWRTRLLKKDNSSIRFVLNDIDLLAKKLENVSLE